MHTYRGQRLASVVFLSHSTTYMFMEGLLLNLRLAGLTRLSGQILASGLGGGGHIRHIEQYYIYGINKDRKKKL